MVILKKKKGKSKSRNADREVKSSVMINEDKGKSKILLLFGLKR